MTLLLDLQINNIMSEAQVTFLCYHMHLFIFCVNWLT